MKLYDYVFNIINKKRSFDEFTKEEKGEYNQFMINKVLSMDYDLLPLTQLNNSFINKIPDSVFDKALQNFIPNKKYSLKYIKGKREKDDIKKYIIEKISSLYAVPLKDAEQYFYELNENQLKLILSEFGIDYDQL